MDIYDDLRALSGSMKIACGCIDLLLKREDIMPSDIDHIDRDLGEVKTALSRAYKHIIEVQVEHENSSN